MVGILLVTHGDIGLALFKSAIHILGKEPSNIDYISINSNIDINSYEKTIQDKLISLDNGKGVLVMSDMYGATPTNILKKLINPKKYEVITGINLPMLMQALTSRALSLDDLIKICLKYGKENIFDINNDEKNTSTNN